MRLPTRLIRAAALLVATTLGGTLAAQTANAVDDERITDASNEMAVSLYRELSSEQESFVFSPWSIYTLLALLSGGARGTTADQIAAVLGVPGAKSGVHEDVTRIQDSLRAEGKAGAIELGIANALWPRERYPILPDYLELAARYGAEVTPVDYMREGRAVMKTLNDWAADATDGRITEPVSAPPSADTILMAGSAIYFKGLWQAQFDPKETIGQPFYGAHWTTEVPLMFERQEYRIIDEDGLQILEIPFLAERLAMIVVLPAVDQPLSRWEATLSPETVMTVVTQQWTDVVDVYLPRFTLKSRIELRKHLQSMGITDLFERAVADLSGIDGVPNRLFVGKAQQNAFVTVNEEGAEAAAVSLGGGCFPAGTLVATRDGFRTIESVASGTPVAARDQGSGKWVWAQCSGVTRTEYSGDMVEITAAGETVEATGNHPFLVLRGAELDNRPESRDVPADERSPVVGRWVAARDLNDGDVILGRAGDVTVEGVRRYSASELVFNLAVEEHHTYAVGTSGLLVHNKGSDEVTPVEFRADHPFIYLIRDSRTGLILFMGRVLDLR